MSIERWRPGGGPPWAEHDWPSRIFSDWDRFLRPFWGPRGGFFGGWGLEEPAVDVFETDQHMVVKAELPGIDPADLKVSVTEDSISFRGETREERDEKQEGYHWRERRHGLVQRLLPLARTIDPQTARASYRNGVLTVRAEKVRGSRGQVVDVKVESDETGFGGRRQ